MVLHEVRGGRGLVVTTRVATVVLREDSFAIGLASVFRLAILHTVPPYVLFHATSFTRVSLREAS